MTDSEQQRLFRFAVEDLHASAHFVPGQGWMLAIWARRGGEANDQAYRVRYSYLTTPELVDAIDGELGALLGL